MTIGLCCNADGSEKLKPLIISHSKKPRCFGRFDPQTMCYYYHNTKAWMTMFIWEDWLKKINSYFLLRNRKILLLIDNCPGHNMSQELINQLTNVKVVMFAPNMTSNIQPLDAGIIHSFKCYYKKLFLANLINQIEDYNEYELINQLEAMNIIKQAWHSVSLSTIRKCWRHSNILFNNFLLEEQLDNYDYDVKMHNQTLVSSINDQVIQLNQYSRFNFYFDESINTVESFISDPVADLYEPMTDEDIIKLVQQKYKAQEDEIDNVENIEEKILEPITLSKTKRSVDDLLRFWTINDLNNDDDLCYD